MQSDMVTNRWLLLSIVLLSVSILYSRWKQRKLIIFFTVSEKYRGRSLDTVDFVRLSPHVEHAFRIANRFQEWNVDAKEDHIATTDWQYAVIINAFANEEMALHFMNAFRNLDLVDDVYAISFTVGNTTCVTPGRVQRRDGQ